MLTNLAVGSIATASSQDNVATGLTAANAIDGQDKTRWASLYSDNQWLAVDLGIPARLCGFTLSWEAAYGSAYQIQISNDGNTWSTVHTVTNGDGAMDNIVLTAPVTARYVRMLGITRGSPWGYSLWEFKVNGNLFGQPLANFIIGAGPTLNMPVELDAATSIDVAGSIATYSWNFGDGTTAVTTTSKTSHIYSTPGNFEVELRITDNDGNQATKKRSLVVGQKLSTEGDGDYVIGPDYSNKPPELNDKNVPHGKNYSFQMNSSDSALYRGDDSTLTQKRSFTRNIRVYVPQQYVNGTAAPFMIVHDGGWFSGEIIAVLNNFIAKGVVKPIVVISVDNGGGDSKGSQRGLEYDTMSDRFSRFITSEVLPKVENLSEIRKDYPNFSLTTDPNGRGAFGCSSGGAAALAMGWFTPNEFRRIITYSGTFVDQQDDDATEEVKYPFGAWEYHNHLIADSNIKPLRIFMQAGSNDNGANRDPNDHHNWLSANQRMAKELAKKGYYYRYVFAQGAGHCDASAVPFSLPTSLRWMWSDYK